MIVQTTFVTDKAIGITWDKIPGAVGYNIYRDDKKLNAEPVADNFYNVEGLSQNTYCIFYVAAVAGGQETEKSDVLFAATKCGPVVDNMLPSGVGKEINMPFSDLALNMEYRGFAMNDPNYYYWCISPIEGDDGRIHIFTFADGKCLIITLGTNIWVLIGGAAIWADGRIYVRLLILWEIPLKVLGHIQTLR